MLLLQYQEGGDSSAFSCLAQALLPLLLCSLQVVHKVVGCLQENCRLLAELLGGLAYLLGYEGQKCAALVFLCCLHRRDLQSA